MNSNEKSEGGGVRSIVNRLIFDTSKDERWEVRRREGESLPMRREEVNRERKEEEGVEEEGGGGGGGGRGGRNMKWRRERVMSRKGVGL